MKWKTGFDPIKGNINAAAGNKVCFLSPYMKCNMNCNELYLFLLWSKVSDYSVSFASFSVPFHLSTVSTFPFHSIKGSLVRSVH